MDEEREEVHCMSIRKWKAKGGNLKGQKSRAAQRKERVYVQLLTTENHVHCMNGDISETAQDRLGQKHEPKRNFHLNDTLSQSFTIVGMVIKHRASIFTFG